jgi:hypothetical protein
MVADAACADFTDTADCADFRGSWVTDADHPSERMDTGSRLVRVSDDELDLHGFLLLEL